VFMTFGMLFCRHSCRSWVLRAVALSSVSFIVLLFIPGYSLLS
jgi:hypothetical protein